MYFLQRLTSFRNDREDPLFHARPPFLSAAQPTDQGEVSLVVAVGDLGGPVFESTMYSQNGCIQIKLLFKMGASRENFSSTWVHPEKTFLQNGCIQRKLFFNMGASRENFSSKWVHPEKTFLQNGCIHGKHCFKMDSSSPFLLQNLEKELFFLLKSLFMTLRFLF